MKKRWLLMLFIMCSFFFITKASAATHYYTQSLSDFIKKDGTRKTAILTDLDNDSADEMITYRVKSVLNGYIISELCIFDIENGKNIIIIEEYTGGSSGNDAKKYVSTAGYIISDLASNYGNSYKVLKYKNGTVARDVLNAELGIGINLNYTLNNSKITEKEFEEFCRGVGMGSIKKLIASEAGNAHNDYDAINKLTVPSPPAVIVNTQTKVIFDGKTLDLSLPVKNVNSRTYFPMRELFESLGAKVSWNQFTKSATATLNFRSVRFIIDSNIYYVNTKSIKMEDGMKAFIDNGRTYVPINNAATALGFKVSWDNAQNAVIIER